jgi:signal peptidase
MKKVLKIHRSIVIVVGVIIAVALLSLATGLRLCTVQSGSMEPTIPTYSVCLVTTRVSYDDLSVGDIVVYTRASDGEQIVHRVVDITDTGAITRGDANHFDDGVSVTADNLYARYIAHVPYLGHVYNLVRSPVGATIIAVLVIALIVLNIMTAKQSNKS